MDSKWLGIKCDFKGSIAYSGIGRVGAYNFEGISGCAVKLCLFFPTYLVWCYMNTYGFKICLAYLIMILGSCLNTVYAFIFYRVGALP